MYTCDSHSKCRKESCRFTCRRLGSSDRQLSKPTKLTADFYLGAMDKTEVLRVLQDIIKEILLILQKDVFFAEVPLDGLTACQVSRHVIDHHN